MGVSTHGLHGSAKRSSDSHLQQLLWVTIIFFGDDFPEEFLHSVPRNKSLIQNLLRCFKSEWVETIKWDVEEKKNTFIKSSATTSKQANKEKKKCWKKKTAQQKQSRRSQFDLRLHSVNLCATRSKPTMPPIAWHLAVFWVGVLTFIFSLPSFALSISQLNN